MASFHLNRSQVHWTWNPAHPPALEVESSDVVVLEIANASGGQIGPDSTADAVSRLDFSRVNPVTGPIYVRGAQPGDALRVDILSIDLDSWGWTANIPGFGLLQDQFPNPHLRISRVTEQYAELMPGVRIPVAPFIGSIGTAMAEPGDHSLVPPSRQGGNMDMRHITAGASLWLPVAVPGGLLSVGDTHAAQGDGEVAGTAIETSSTVALRITLIKQAGLETPRVLSHPAANREGPRMITTGIGPDLWHGARAATERMIDWLAVEGGFSREDAYLDSAEKASRFRSLKTA
jgi:acetamidase/formamidase